MTPTPGNLHGAGDNRQLGLVEELGVQSVVGSGGDVGGEGGLPDCQVGGLGRGLIGLQ